MAPQIVGYVTLTLKFEREGSKWVGTCLELGTSTFARTLKQAEEELRELVTAHLNALEQAGERARFFKQWGIVFHRTLPQSREFRIRDTEADWNRFAKGASASLGPFFQPGVFPIGQKGAPSPVSVGV